MDLSDIKGRYRDPGQRRFLIGKAIDGALSCLTVLAHIGDLIEPAAGSRWQGTEVTQCEPVKKIFFDVTHAIFHPSLLIPLANTAGLYGEAIMIGKGLEMLCITFPG